MTSANRFENSTVDVSRVLASREALKLIPGRHARRWGVLPLAIEGETLLVTLAQEENDSMLAQLETQTGLSVRVLPAANPAGVTLALRRYYPDDVSENSSTPLGLLDELINRALQIRCSDIHIDPESDKGYVRMRVDGLMRVERELSLAAVGELVSAIKVAAALDIAEKRAPQDGQITLQSLGEEISMRVATIPTIRGEKVTLRILATAAVAVELAELDTLGMSALHYQLMQRTLDFPNGIILLCGPTGSGKTTTLYAALRRLRAPQCRHILSIEDPVEIPLDGINQVHVDAERVSFGRALRSILRHDPDVIMIGEIRDAETADIAVKSAMTGHLVLSTLHTNDSVGVITRLHNLGVPTDLITATLRLVIAQRLVRRPCRHCCQSEVATPEELTEFGLESTASLQAPRVEGCSFCAHTGYAGRVGLYEMLPMTEGLRTLIHEGASEEDIRKATFSECALPSLTRDGVEKVLAGKSTFDEVRRVTLLGEDS